MCRQCCGHGLIAMHTWITLFFSEDLGRFGRSGSRGLISAFFKSGMGQLNGEAIPYAGRHMALRFRSELMWFESSAKTFVPKAHCSLFRETAHRLSSVKSYLSSLRWPRPRTLTISLNHLTDNFRQSPGLELLLRLSCIADFVCSYYMMKKLVHN